METNFLKNWILKRSVKGLPSFEYDKVVGDFERFLSCLFNSIQEGISILDNNLNIVGTNLVMKDWYKHKKPFIGKKCYEVYHDRTKPCNNCPSLEAIESQKSSVGIIRYKRDNNKGYHELYSFPLFDDEKKIIGVIEYVRDITTVKEIENLTQRLKKRLSVQNKTLKEQEITIKLLFKEKEKEEKKILSNFIKNINILIKPILEDLKISLKNDKNYEKILFLEKNIKNISKPIIKNLPINSLEFTNTELKVISLIKEGLNSRQIAEFLGVTKKSIDFHRLNIRKKLDINGKKVNLATYLLNL